MDNARDVPGYKYYVRASDRCRGAWFVVFLNLREDSADCLVNGVLLSVDASRLPRLDEREQNYRRVEITDRVVEPVDGKVWTYLGTPAAIERFHRAMDEHAAVVSQGYLQGVIDDFAALGARHLRQFEDSTDRLPCPVDELIRIDLP